MKAPKLHPRIRPVITALLLLATVGLATIVFPNPTKLANLLRPVRLSNILPSPQPTPPPPTVEAIGAAIKLIREERELPAMAENVTLQKLARLLALEIEDQGVLAQPESADDVLRTLTPNPPRRLETLLWFVPDATAFDAYTQLSSASSVLDSRLRSFGAASRQAQVEGQEGWIVIVTLSSSFSSTVASPPPQAPSGSRPTFTGQDLWAAVQNYRQAHNLPLFSLSTELCTVASIRVNQLLELGKLDNHAGFQPLADQFFKDNTGWSAINENIAAGYQTAVQTVEWGWDQSLGHQALIQSREFPKACAAANSGFSVLVTGR